MTVTNNLVQQVDLPVWEWCRFAPEATAATYTMCSPEISGAQYIYYMGATNLWRYDTISDGWQRLAGPQIPVSTVGATRYSYYGGYRGNVLSATNTTVTIPGLMGNKLVGKTIRITSGTGAGQEREIKSITHSVVEFGVASTTTNATQIMDNQTIPKKWLINQWAGYQCRVVFGTGDTQVRRILYNSQNTLYFNDVNWQAYDSWNNTGFSAIAPNAAPATNTNYSIEKSVAVVDAWTTNPDASSKFVVLSGAVWLYTGRTVANGSAAIQYYDTLSDTWIIKMCTGGLQNTVTVTDASIERTGEIGGAFDSGDCDDTSTSMTMQDTTKTWLTDRYARYQIRVKDTATETEQRRRIVGNTTDTLYINKPWDSTPTSACTYEIYGDTNAIWMVGNARAQILKYLIEEDIWVQGQEYDTGVCANMSIKKAGTLPFGYTATVNTAGITAVSAAPTVAGTGYKVGDVLNVTQSANAKVRVTSVSTGGAVTGVELFAGGTGTATTGSGKATTAFFPATGGTGCTIEIASVGNVARVTTTMNHNFVVGDSVTTYGADVSAWNSTFTLTTVEAVNICEFAAPNTVAPTRSTINAVSNLVDACKNWATNEHVGRVITKYTGAFPINTTESRKITANTGSVITIASNWTLPVTGKDRYVIHEMKAFGRDAQYKVSNQDSTGWATSGSPTTLVDNTKSWQVDQWANYKMNVLCGTGYDKGEITITGNDATTLTLSSPGFTPDTTTKYEIMDSWGMATGTFAATTLQDTTKNWAVNQWAGKQVKFTAGTLLSYEVAITSNTANTLTYATTTTVSDASCCYTILAPPVKGSGIQAIWNYGRSSPYTGGRFLLVPRGGSSASLGSMTLDVYDITTDRWMINMLANPQTEMQTLGCQWAYDGGDYIYCTQTGTSSRVFRIDMNTYEVSVAGQPPYAHGTAVIGNRMEIIVTADGLKYLYLMRSTGSELWRTLLWW